MITRRIHNHNAPLTNPKGVLLANTSISFVIVDENGKRVDVFDTETQERVSGLVTVTTDTNAEFEIDLFPTTRADRLCFYLVHVHNNAFLDFRAALQEGTTPITWFAFKHGGINITPYEFSLIQYYLDNFIDDTSTRVDTTWSSNKIQEKLDEKADIDHLHDNDHTHLNKPILDDLSDNEGKLLYKGEAIKVDAIDDTQVSTATTYSSSKIEELTHYIHHQVVAASTWVIPHTMGGYPSVITLDSAGNEMTGKVEYKSESLIEVTFTPGEFAGIASLR